MIAKPERERFDTSHLIYVPLCAGKGCSLMQSRIRRFRCATWLFWYARKPALA
jgi:hypothetical protein